MSSSQGNEERVYGRGHETVLLVEDEPALRRLAEHYLQSKGYRVFAAANGEEALRIWSEHAEEIDLVLSDMMMPDIDGRKLAQQFRERRPELKVLFTSGYSRETMPEEIFIPGARLVEKPFTLNVLLRVIREVLDEVA